MVRPRKIADIKPILTNVAQTSHYQVFFDGLSSDLFKFIGSKGVNKRFIKRMQDCYVVLHPYLVVH